MRSLLRVVHDERLGGSPVSLESIARRYRVRSLKALIAAHDQALRASHGPFTFSGQILTGGAAALGGSIAVTINPDGSIRWQGHAHDSGLDGYDFAISALVRASSGRAVALAHRGHVGGTFTPGPRDHDWNEPQPPNSVNATNVGDFANAGIQTHLEYTSDIGSVFEDAFNWLLKFGVGSLLTPVGVVVFVGMEVGSLISTGSLVPGARMAEGILWMAGPANSMFAIAAEGIASLGSRIRFLTQEEYDWANGQVFLGALPPRDRLILTDTIGGGNRAFTFPRYDGKITLNMGPQAFADPRAYNVGNTRQRYPSQQIKRGEVFVHELVHACQIEHNTNLGYLADGLASKVCEVGGPSAYTYPPAGPDYASMGIEQQAQIISDWYAGAQPIGCNQTSTERDTNSPYFRYVNDNLRVGMF
jgi:hypothetical protein